MIFSQCSSCKYAWTWQSRAFSVISMYKICILYIRQWNRKTYITRVSQNTHAVCTEHYQRSTCCTADTSSTLQLVAGAFIVTYSSSHHYGRRNNKPTNQWAHVCTPGLLWHQAAAHKHKQRNRSSALPGVNQQLTVTFMTYKCEAPSWKFFDQEDAKRPIIYYHNRRERSHNTSTHIAHRVKIVCQYKIVLHLHKHSHV